MVSVGGDELARTFYLNPQIYNKLYACMTYENALALRVSLETGLRIGDVLKIETKDFNGRTITGVAEKTGKPFKKVVSMDLAHRLKQISSEKWVFTGRFGNKPRTRQAVWKNLKKAVKILEITGNIAPHSARKTYAVECFKDNGLGNVKKELQHDDINTTMVYAFSDLIDTMPAQPGFEVVKNSEKPSSFIKNKFDDQKKTASVPSWCLDFAEIVADLVVEKLKPILQI